MFTEKRGNTIVCLQDSVSEVLLSWNFFGEILCANISEKPVSRFKGMLEFSVNNDLCLGLFITHSCGFR